MLTFLSIMLCCTAQKFYLLCLNYAQALCLISVLLINLQLWAHNKWLKQIFALQNACDRKDQYVRTVICLIVLLELLTVLLELLTVLLEYINIFL